MQARHFIQLMALSGVWGSGFLFTRMATPYFGPAVTSAARLGLGALTLALIMHHARVRWPWEHWKEMLLLGGLGLAGTQLLYAWSSLHMPAGYSAMLGVMSVLFGAFASAWLAEEPLTRTKLLGCALAFIGVAFVVQLGSLQVTPSLMLGALAAMGGALLSGCSAPLYKRATRRIEPMALTAGIHLAGFMTLLPSALWELPRARFSFTALVAVLIMGIAISGMAYWLYMRIVKLVTPIGALSSTFMTTIFGVFWGHLFLGETFTLGSYVGGLVVVLAAMMVTGFNPLRRLQGIPRRPVS